MMFRDMMKYVSGVCCAAVMIGGVSVVDGVSGMKAGDVILPEMKSIDGKLKVKELKVPDCLDKYDGIPEIEAIKLRLKEISNVGMSDLVKLSMLVNDLIGDDGARDNLFSLMTEKDNCSLYCMQDHIAVRLLELGDWSFRWVASEFYTPSEMPSQACADSLLYDNEMVSRDLVAAAGWYIEAVDAIRRSLDLKECGSLLSEIILTIDKERVPTIGYVSWALSMGKRAQNH